MGLVKTKLIAITVAMHSIVFVNVFEIPFKLPGLLLVPQSDTSVVCQANSE